MNEKDDQLTAATESLLDLMGELAPEEPLELRASLSSRLREVFRVGDIPLPLCERLADPLVAATPLEAWCRERVGSGRFDDEEFAPLLVAAAMVDHLAGTDRPLLAFVPAAWRVDENGRLAVFGPRLDLARFRPDLNQLTEYQRKSVKRYMHPNLLRSMVGVELSTAGVYSMTLFLLDVFVGVQAPTRAELQDALERYPCHGRRQAPPDLPLLFRQVITAPVNKRLGWTCQELVSAVLRSFRENPFGRGPSVDLGVRHGTFAYSVPGLNKEGLNEDRYYIGRHGAASLLLIADGVSTADLGSGAMAAEEVVRLMEFEFADRFRAVVEDCSTAPQTWPEAGDAFLTEFFAAAQQKVVEQVNLLFRRRGDQATAPRAPMCSTLTAALVWGDSALIHYVGDSPAWLFSPSRNLFCKLTAEHHAERERDFSFDPQPDAAALTRVIGACELPLIGESFVAVEQAGDRLQVRLQPGDLLMLASDGLLEGIDAPGEREKLARFEAEVRRLGQPGADLKKLVRQLIALAEDGLSHDNITLNALRLEAEEQHGRGNRT